MRDSIEKYIQDINEKFRYEETSELGYRTGFELLLQKIFESIKVKRIDHDARTKDGNKPDFAVLSGDIPLVYIETKDIGVSLDKVEKSEQMSRYYGYANLVLTDYLEFRFYRNGLSYGEPVKIANYDIKNRSVDPISENYELLAKTLLEFTQSYKEPIKSGKHLSKIMAGKARRIRDNIRQFLSAELENKTELVKLYESIKKFLVHDLTVDSFSDMYSQTLVYGLFIARFNDTSLSNFTRSEASDLIPNSNPFLHRFFDHIARTDFDNRLKFIVDELCEVFSHANISDLLKQYSNEDLWGKAHKKPDPVIYFYEDFLREYDPELKKEMGAFYTPEPVVQFIVKAVDSVLKDDFKLNGGLGDISKTSKNLHRVQILDLATGTGTFISAVIRSIYKPFNNPRQKPAWPKYVQTELLPRLFGFEIMMAPYTIAHLKLSMAFKETGFKYFNSKRLGIYLTNSLEKSIDQDGLFASVGLSDSIAEESIEASKIKNERPIMVVIGNPPYNGISSNKTEYASKLVEKYKTEPGGIQKLQERKHWLNDDYVKFIALAEDMVSKNSEGIVAFITNNGYLNNPTFRGMRWHLLKTFNKIFILNLHGSTKKGETTPSGQKDENVFDIQQGVAIIVAIKNKIGNNNLPKINYVDVWGKRSEKFDFLNKFSLEDIKWNLVDPKVPNLFFTSTSQETSDLDDRNSFKLNDLFIIKGVGVVTARDGLTIDFDRERLWKRVNKFQELSSEQARSEFNLGKDAQSWKVSSAQKDIQSNLNNELLKQISYRPFDIRFCYYTGKSSGFIARPSEKVMRNFLSDENIGLVLVKQFKTGDSYQHVFVSKNITESTLISNRTSEIGYTFPLYIFSQTEGIKLSNFKDDIVNQIKEVAGNITNENIFDYIYATLHSSYYTSKYKEFLKIDFPRIPYPKSKDLFYKMASLGKELRDVHLFESPKLNSLITSYGSEGNDIVEKIIYKNGNVYINETQYFGGVPEVAWNFYVGSYQPAQKWLKDRKGRELSYEDIEHYQKMVVALVETDKIMKEIDNV
jgi:predicted helicase